MNKCTSLAIMLLLLGNMVCCSQEKSEEKLLMMVWDTAVPEDIEITRVIGDQHEGFAIFANISKQKFDSFKKTTAQYKSWHPLKEGMVFEFCHTELKAISDISGIYSVGESSHGLKKVIVWDEQKETLVLMLASGMM